MRVYDAGTDGMGVMYEARRAKVLILVDASRSGAEPGSVFEVPGEELVLARVLALVLRHLTEVKRWAPFTGTNYELGVTISGRLVEIYALLGGQTSRPIW